MKMEMDFRGFSVPLTIDWLTNTGDAIKDSFNSQLRWKYKLNKFATNVSELGALRRKKSVKETTWVSNSGNLNLADI